MNALHLSTPSGGEIDNETLFAKIADDLYAKGYSIQPNALPMTLAEDLLEELHSSEELEFKTAGIGRGRDLTTNEFVRTDKICWIQGTNDTCSRWLEWTGALQSYLNRRLFLGLFSFESHFAHYRPGDFYKRHVDAFKGNTNRVLSLVTYLNTDWGIDDGGEMVLYQKDDDFSGTKVTPGLGTVAIFLSEEFPHEVLASRRDRYSIAGWFRVNNSLNGQLDPPK